MKDEVFVLANHQSPVTSDEKSMHLRVFILAFLASLIVSAVPALAQDKDVFGIGLGSAFRVPQCGAKDGIVYSTRTCYNGVPTRTAWGADQYDVGLPNAEAPPYVRGDLAVFVIDGVVESVRVNTWGIQAQGGAMKALTAKYGKPAKAGEQKRNKLRSRFNSQFAEWTFPDFSVKFEGMTSSIDWGQIDIATPRYLKRLDDHNRRQTKS
jgi:hypothetical protein